MSVSLYRWNTSCELVFSLINIINLQIRVERLEDKK